MAAPTKVRPASLGIRPGHLFLLLVGLAWVGGFQDGALWAASHADPPVVAVVDHVGRDLDPDALSALDPQAWSTSYVTADWHPRWGCVHTMP